MKEKKYKEAKQSYIDAKAAFEKAGAGVEAGKKAIADQANAALTALEGTWKNLEAKARKMKKWLKDKKDARATHEKAVRDGLEKAKEMVATAPAEAKAKLDELKTMVENGSRHSRKLPLLRQNQNRNHPRKRKKKGTL